jgi:DNA primase
MNFAEHLKAQLNIVDVVGQYVRLKRQGASPRYIGLCPFHTEKTPSFNVNGDLQFYKCFGCDAAGDVFNFVGTIESLTFPETLRLLADRYGIPFPERHRNDNPEAQLQAALLEAIDAAADLFQQNLRSAAGAHARKYLASRGISDASMSEFRLGLSEPSGQQIVLRLKRFGDTILEGAGLIAKRTEGNGYYDRFRGRLMFPIHDESGKVIAFGARAMNPDDKPKYTNSPETKLYKKSSVLYNLHRAKTAARKNDRMILVEGYMDAIAIYAAGVTEVAAVCGTKLGLDQVRAIKRQISHQSNSGHVILNFDPDVAGAASAEKYISLLLGQNLRVKVLEIPGQLDPDEYIQGNGADAYRKLLDKCPSYFHWLTDRTRARFDIQTPEGRIDAFKSMLPSIREVNEPLERATIANEIAEQLRVDREVIRQALGRSTSPQVPGPSRHRSSAVPPNEKLLLSCLLAGAEARAIILHYFSDPAHLDDLELRAVFARAQEQSGADTFSLPNLLDKLEPQLQKIVEEIAFKDCGVTENDAADQAMHCLKALEARSHGVKYEALRRRVREFEAAGKLTEALELMTELDRLGPRPAAL